MSSTISLFLVHFFLSFPKCHIISVLFINGPMAESKTDVPYKEKSLSKRRQGADFRSPN